MFGVFFVCFSQNLQDFHDESDDDQISFANACMHALYINLFMSNLINEAQCIACISVSEIPSLTKVHVIELISQHLIYLELLLANN